MRNALTIDVEEHFQAHAYENVIDRSAWERFPSRVVRNTQRVLEVLADHRTHATFFVLGWVAERHPDLVRAIAAAGHEIGSHGYAHQLLYRQSPAEFADDLARSLGAIERALGGGNHLLGYRAPGFSLTDETLWALDILRAHGLAYDSSLQPVDRRGGSALRGGKRCGVSGASRFAARVGAGLWEFPVSTVRLGGRNWPVAGGGYFRLLPLWVTRQAIARINAEGQPAIVYLHPWELDPEEPRLPEASTLSSLRHRVNLGRTEGRLRRLLGKGQFGPLRDVFADRLRAA
ncbi:MAG TPA: XrtA system polysaccharide deacetylase [Candidatus Binatus sp.]|nr:XrtA system polysaccharide deacetylase [Candidatus Binatus sp.]